MPVPKDLGFGDWNVMVDSFHAESDRGAAILAGSFVEHTLGTYLRFRMRDPKVADDLFAPMGPLASFAQRIAIAYAFGLIPQTLYRDFDVIRRIRNHFAHHPMDTTFDTPEIKSLAGRLSTANDFSDEQHPKPALSARIAYLLACAASCGRLLNEIEQAQSQ
jgi:hypothetical protein